MGLLSQIGYTVHHCLRSSIGTGGLKATSVTEALKCSGVRVGESASPDLFVPWGGSESRTVYTR